MSEPPSETHNAEQPTFEQALVEVESIVRELEEGQLGLDESLARYERGVRLLRRCHEQLQQAERRIELLAGVTPEGSPVTTLVDDTALSLDEKAQQRSRRRSASSYPPPAQDGASEAP